MLEIIHQFKKFILGYLDTRGCLIGNTKKFQRVLSKPAFYIVIQYTFYLNFAVNPLKFLCVYVRRKMGGRNLYRNQVSVCVLVLIEVGNHGLVSAVLEHGSVKLISDPVEKEQNQKKYGSNSLHSGR